MRKFCVLLLLFQTVAFAQDYQNYWSEVIDLESEGKIKSANEIVDKIYRKAKRHDNEPQLVKVFFFRSKYLFTFDENAQTKILDNLSAEIKSGSPATKGLLRLIKARCLSSYLSRNQYQLRTRSDVDSTLNADFRLWSRDDFEEEISELYEQSLENSSALAKTKLAEYEQIFDYLDEKTFKGESMLDYLLVENINSQIGKIPYSDRANEKLQAYENALSGDVQIFTTTHFTDVPPQSLRVLKLLQQLETNAPSPAKRFFRLKAVYEHFLSSEFDYLKLLDGLQRTTSDTILSANIRLERANTYFELGSRLNKPEYKIRSVALLDSIIGKTGRINAEVLAQSLKQNIMRRSLSVRIKNELYPMENSRARIDYKDVDSLRVSYYRIPSGRIGWLNENPIFKDSLIRQAKRQPPAYAKKYALPGRDYSNHSTEILLPPIDTGNYLVCFETMANEEHAVSAEYEIVTASELTLLSARRGEKNIFTVLDRKSGKPIKNARIKNSLFDKTTDAEGNATVNSPDHYYREDHTVVSTARDTLVTQWNSYRYYGDDEERLIAKANLYLDRGIYRPGQTVYFKGIILQKAKEKTETVAKTSIDVVIHDANYKEVFRQTFQTNDFGSFTGEFKIPASGLTGQYQIETEEPEEYENDPVYDKKEDEHPFWDRVNFNDSGTSFQVEEYKRPKFEVKFDAVSDSFTIGQKVTVKGHAKSFAGSNLTDAQVRYSVMRRTKKLRSQNETTGYYQHYDPYQYDNDSVAIVSDTIKTDASGNFTIVFSADPIADENVADRVLRPVYLYSITADVTDLNQETRSASTTVNVGYHSLVLGVTATDAAKKKNSKFSLSSTNLNNQFKAVKGKLEFYFVSGFSTKFKPREFGKPEIEAIDENQWNALFPYESRLDDQTDDSRAKLVKTIAVDTEKQKELSLDLSAFETGHYKVVFSADDASGKIETSARFELRDPNQKTDPEKLFTITQLNTDARKDGFVKVRVNSPIADLSVRLSSANKRDTYFDKSVTLAGHEAIVTIPIKSTFRNSVLILADAYYDNFQHNAQLVAPIRIPEPLLELETATFRNLIEPGMPETWSFKLTGKNTSTEAEVLAAMYDASLDQFRSSDWSLPYFGMAGNSPETRSVIGRREGYLYYRNIDIQKAMRSLRIEQTQLIWFGFDFNGDRLTYNNKLYRDQITKKMGKPASATAVTGIVSDDAGPLPGANVVVKGSNRGVQTDIDGYYAIDVAPNEVLVFSFVGMEDQEIRAGGEKTINMKMRAGEILGEVVVTTALGMRKNMSEMTSSYAVVGYGAVKEKNAVQALSGMVSGLQISTDGDDNIPTTRIVLRGNRSTSGTNNVLIVKDGEIISIEEFSKLEPDDISNVTVLKKEQGVALYGQLGVNGVILVITKSSTENLALVKTRTNLAETAFFLPNLRTDKTGNLRVNFTSPEALTQWKLRLLAHNKTGVFTQMQRYVTTQKSLMVMPNFPRFLRERDTIVVSAKISNMTKKAMMGTAMLQLFDATNMQSIDAKALNAKNVQSFTVDASGNVAVSWKIFVPEAVQGVQYRIVAKSGDFSDGEENILPVLNNNMLVTESLALWVREKSRKEYTFERLKNNTSTTLKPQLLILEYTSNPTWLALQSLPYLMEYEHECAEQTFSRCYANALALQIVNSNPKIAELFEIWRKNPESKFNKNEQLKSILLAETPWVNDAESDSEQKQRLAVLMDIEKMTASQQATIEKLKTKQLPSGGFVWFDGGRENPYISRHILAGLGHLNKLGVTLGNADIAAMEKNAIAYTDAEFGHWVSIWKKEQPYFRPYTDLHYLYARSFYLADYPMPENLKNYVTSGLEQLKSDWLDLNLYQKAMAALVLDRFGDKASAQKILESLRETASNNEDWGMYWIANQPGWYWYQAPIETQALLIEAFGEIANDKKSVDAMKVWLLKNKQRKNWPTTKSTTEAVYALLMQGSDWLDVKDNTVFGIGNEKIATKKLDETQKEAATGYVKIEWKASEIKKEMATLSVENKSSVPGFGGFYFQYFEDLDQIKSFSGSAMKIEKQLARKVSGESKLQRISAQTPLKPGDLVTVRLEVTVTEDMEYVHLKDMRASCFEPVDVISGYHWQDSAGYYKSTRDAATHFFFDALPKGAYVFEYELRVNNSGDFSSGITTIQSMYAPEFSAHTKGIRVNVK